MLLWKFNSGRFPSRSPFIISLGRWLGQRVSPIRTNVMTSQLRTYLSGALRETKYELSAGDHEKILRRVLDTDLDHDLSVPLELSYAHVIYDELDAVGIQLQARNRDFWDTYDRQTAEADFRIGIAPPLLLIVVLMAMQLGGHLWWLVLILAPIYLVVLGLRNALEATATLVQAVLSKTFILKTAGASTLANWQGLLTPTDAATSVNGQTGAVSLTASGLGALAAANNLPAATPQVGVSREPRDN